MTPLVMDPLLIRSQSNAHPSDTRSFTITSGEWKCKGSLVYMKLYRRVYIDFYKPFHGLLEYYRNCRHRVREESEFPAWWKMKNIINKDLSYVVEHLLYILHLYQYTTPYRRTSVCPASNPVHMAQSH